MGTLARFDLGPMIAKHGLIHFVETGTGEGRSLAHAARFGFKSLRSCELDPVLAGRLSDAFAPDDRIRIVNAESAAFLGRLHSMAAGEPILFWLDAHFPGADHGHRDYGVERSDATRLPLRAELEAIRKHRPDGMDVIICDDLRIWLDGPYQHGGLPEDVRPFCPVRRDASFFAEMFDDTHDVFFDYSHEGYCCIVPKEKTLTLLSPESLATLLALAESTPPGDFVEVGVYRGGVAKRLSELAARRSADGTHLTRLHLFDTFTGIPEKGPEDDIHEIGDFADTSLAAVQAAVPDAVYHVGVYPGTMPKDWWDDVAFVHVDCDQYRCTVAAIVHFLPLLAEGGIMLFDDYAETSGARQAVDGFLGNRIRLTPQGKAYFVKPKTRAVDVRFAGSTIGCPGIYDDGTSPEGEAA